VEGGYATSKLEMWRCSVGKEPHVKITTTLKCSKIHSIYCQKKLKEFKMDEDEPPLLVSGSLDHDETGAMSSEMEDVILSKVPITIVTGMSDVFWRTVSP